MIEKDIKTAPSDIHRIILLANWIRHKQFVEEGISFVTNELERRATVHDASKLLRDEFEGFATISHMATVNRFGTKEYDDNLKSQEDIINLHYSRNSHHPEKTNLNFLDVIEMVCDWWGARKGYNDSRSWKESYEINIEKKYQYMTHEQMWLARQVAEYLATKPGA